AGLLYHAISAHQHVLPAGARRHLTLHGERGQGARACARVMSHQRAGGPWRRRSGRRSRLPAAPRPPHPAADPRPGPVAAPRRERREAVRGASTTREGYFGLWLRRWGGLPYVIYAHGNEVLQAMKISWPVARHALVSADRVFANSRFTAGLVEEAGVASERIV